MTNMSPQVAVARLSMIVLALSLHVKTGGKMRLTRTASPATLLKLATEYTGKTYKRGQHKQALEDCTVVRDTLRAENAAAAVRAMAAKN